MLGSDSRDRLAFTRWREGHDLEALLMLVSWTAGHGEGDNEGKHGHDLESASLLKLVS